MIWEMYVHISPFERVQTLDVEKSLYFERRFDEKQADYEIEESLRAARGKSLVRP